MTVKNDKIRIISFLALKGGTKKLKAFTKNV